MYFLKISEFKTFKKWNLKKNCKESFDRLLREQNQSADIADYFDTCIDHTEYIDHIESISKKKLNTDHIYR